MPKNLNYPLASFQKAFALADAVDSLGGKSSVETCAEKMQRKVSGGFMVIISSAQKFSLIGFEKGIITITEDYKLIKHSYTITERIAFLRKAFLAPQVFSILYNRFKGKELPVDMLDKILIREFGVDENTASRVAGYFVEGLKTYNLLNGLNVVEGVQEPISEKDEIGTEKSEQSSIVVDQVSAKAPEEIPDASFTTKKSATSYEVQLSGPGINSKISISDEEDLLILEAILKKIRKDIRGSSIL